jgi:adenosine kinase
MLASLMTAKIFVSGSIAFDHLMTTKLSLRGLSFPEHGVATHSILSDTLFKNDGGTAANIAHSMSLLGLHPAIISTIGSDGKAYIDRLKSRGIDTEHVTTIPELPTAHASALTDSVGNQIFFFCPGALDVPASYPTEKAEYAIIAPGNHADMYALPAVYRSQGVPFIYDPGQMIHSLAPDALIEGMTCSHTLIMNEFEWGEFCRKLGMNVDEVLMRTTRVIVTRGERGCSLYSTDGETHIEAVHVTSEDTMGAGDAFRGGYVYGLVCGMSPEKAMSIGCAMASFCVEVRGTQTYHPRIDDIAKRFEDTYKQAFPRYTTA